MTIDELAQLIRSIDDWRSLGAGALAEALHPAIPEIEAMPDLEAALDKEWVYSADLKQQLAAAREALQAAEADAARYRWLRDSPRCSLTVNHNDHHCMYQSVADTMDDTQCYYSDVPEDEKARMIATDSIWTVHEYPNTPVGFNVYHAATLDTAIDEAIATLQRDRQP